jgi:hypothetical protein
MNASENTSNRPAKNKVESYDIARSDETLHLATDLAKFIKENKLTTTVQGKEFVNVEGWQYAGSRLGIVPIVDHVINVSNEQEIKYQAKVTLFDMRSGQTVGAGFAVCSSKEQGKKFYQEFAIMSMAQTRAIGKAYRNILAWIIRAAGYEPTPAEEMDYSAPAAAPAQPVATAAEPAPAPMRVSRPATAAEAVAAKNAADAAAGVVYLSDLQKALIMLLLNNPVVARPEKSKMLLNINRITRERADTSITRLIKAIEDANGDLPADLAERRAAIAAEFETKDLAA